MKIQQHLEKQRIILKHIECEPVWEKEKIVLFDMFLKATGEWLGSKRLLNYCERFDASI